MHMFNRRVIILFHCIEEKKQHTTAANYNDIKRYWRWSRLKIFIFSNVAKCSANCASTESL